MSDDRITVPRVLLLDVLAALRGDMDPDAEAFLREQVEAAFSAPRTKPEYEWRVMWTGSRYGMGIWSDPITARNRAAELDPAHHEIWIEYRTPAVKPGSWERVTNADIAKAATA